MDPTDVNALESSALAEKLDLSAIEAAAREDLAVAGAPGVTPAPWCNHDPALDDARTVRATDDNGVTILVLGCHGTDADMALAARARTSVPERAGHVLALCAALRDHAVDADEPLRWVLRRDLCSAVRDRDAEVARLGALVRERDAEILSLRAAERAAIASAPDLEPIERTARMARDCPDTTDPGDVQKLGQLLITLCTTLRTWREVTGHYRPEDWRSTWRERCRNLAPLPDEDFDDALSRLLAERQGHDLELKRLRPIDEASRHAVRCISATSAPAAKTALVALAAGLFPGDPALENFAAKVAACFRPSRVLDIPAEHAEAMRDFLGYLLAIERLEDEAETLRGKVDAATSTNDDRARLLKVLTSMQAETAKHEDRLSGYGVLAEVARTHIAIVRDLIRMQRNLTKEG